MRRSRAFRFLCTEWEIKAPYAKKRTLLRSSLLRMPAHAVNESNFRVLNDLLSLARLLIITQSVRLHLAGSSI
jgi:hypothetical protein